MIHLIDEELTMTPADVLSYYKSRRQFNIRTGMSPATLSNWIAWGFVPEHSQYKLERLTKGELKTEWTKDDK